MDLNGQWEFRQDGGALTSWMPATVPGCQFTDLLALDKIPQPFVGRNELAVQWVGDANWVYRKTFTVARHVLDRTGVDLVCEGLDTVARLSLNGQPLGETDNMFRRWTFAVRDLLREGQNTLEIHFTSLKNDYGTRLLHRLTPMATDVITYGSRGYSIAPYRRAPYLTGWDWGPCLSTCGVWRSIRLVASDAPRVSYLTSRQQHEIDPVSGQRTVELTVTAELEAPRAASARLAIEVAGIKVQRSLVVPAGNSRHAVVCRVPQPELWWPTGLGAQALYELRVTLHAEGEPAQVTTKRLGFRTMRLETRPDAAGVGMKVVVNGQPVFCKGANWIPCDSFPTRVTPQRYRQWLEDAVAGNMNMLRVWGGGIYEREVFYELCDELGLMVWQEFMFACNRYPGESGFLDNVRQEAIHNLKLLMDHPCLAFWCGGNEIWMLLDRKDPIQVQNYLALFHDALPQAVTEVDPDRDYWPSSPFTMIDGDEQLSGDMHIWDVWHGNKPFERFDALRPRFASEFGFQSFPPLRTIQAYADPTDLNLTAPDVAFHQKNEGGNTRILSQMMDRFRMPEGFASFVVLSQLQQALAMQWAIEHWRRCMPHCMGTLYWQFDDCWPVASWSSIDYYGRWKALHYFTRRFFAPFLVSFAKGNNDNVPIHATADVVTDARCRLSWTLGTYQGRTVATGEAEWTMDEPGSRLVATVPAGDYVRAGQCTWENSYIDVLASDGVRASRNTYHFRPYKDLELPRPRLTVQTRPTSQGVEVTVQTDVFAKWVWLEPQGATDEGRFSDNYFDLNPGELRAVLYTGPEATGFKAQSLVDTWMQPV